MHRNRPQAMPLGLTPTTLLNFMKKLKKTHTFHVMTSCLMKMYNMVRDNPNMELTVNDMPGIQWPTSLGSRGGDMDINIISMVLHTFLEIALAQQPNEIPWIKCKAELSLIDEHYPQALKYYVSMLIVTTEYFTAFTNSPEEEMTIQKMAQASAKLGAFTQAAVLTQMSLEPNYVLAFKYLSERTCNDSCDDLYDYIWDINLLEYLVNLHTRRGEIDRKLKAVQLIGQLELNANNSEGVLKEAAKVRKSRFFRILAKQYL
jgi:integrator complex subunit 8